MVKITFVIFIITLKYVFNHSKVILMMVIAFNNFILILND